MDASANIKRFLAYVADQPDARPAFHLKVRAMSASVPPTFSYTMPLGDVFAFPDFLVFLTTVTDKPGGKIMLNFMVEGMTDYVRTGITLNRWVAHPASILLDVGKALANRGPRDDKLQQALTSPNSFFVPFDHIRRVEAGRQLTQGSYVKVSTVDGDYIIHQDAAVEPWLKSTSTLLGAQWEPQFTAFLQAAAARNASGTEPKRQVPTPPRPAVPPPPSQTQEASQPKPPAATAAPIAPTPQTGTAQPRSPAAPPAPPRAPAPPAPPRAPAPPPPVAPVPVTASSQPRRSNGCGVLLTLLVVALVIGAVALAQRNGHSGGNGGGSGTPNVAGHYSGTAYNNSGLSAPMTLSLIQDGTSLTGSFAISRPLGGSGTLQGQVDSSGGVSFQVRSYDGTGVVIDFTGTLSGSGTELSGTYSVNNGQSGTWDVTQ